MLEHELELGSSRTSSDYALNPSPSIGMKMRTKIHHEHEIHHRRIFKVIVPTHTASGAVHGTGTATHCVVRSWVLGAGCWELGAGWHRYGSLINSTVRW